jgi:hypothetical protein
MKRRLLYLASPCGVLPADVDIARVIDLPSIAVGQAEGAPTLLEAPALVLPVTAAMSHRLRGQESARAQINAAIVDGMAFPIVAAQCAEHAIACVFERSDEDGQRLLAAGRARGWIPVCMQDGPEATLMRVDRVEEANRLLAHLDTSAPPDASDYSACIKATLWVAAELFLQQPAELQPSRLSVRILASRRRQVEIIAAAMALIRDETVH